MKILKITLNSDDATRFLKIRQRLNYDSNAIILKTLIQQHVRHFRKKESPDKEHVPLYGNTCDPKEEGLQVYPTRYVTSGKRVKIVRNMEPKVNGDSLQIKIRLTDRETKTLNEIIENSGGKVRSHYQIAKTLIREFLKYHEGEMVPADIMEVFKLRKKWRKSEKFEK